MLPNTTLAFRRATPAELPTLIAIDDDAGKLFAEAGIVFAGPAVDAFAAAEYARWQRAAEVGRAELALDAWGLAVGFSTLGFVDGAPYLDQLSVRHGAMRRGVGRALLARAVAWADEQGGELWLTTYAHVPWNRPMYERAGFVVVPERACGPELREVLAEQRAALPEPAQRVAMRRRVGGRRSSRAPAR